MNMKSLFVISSVLLCNSYMNAQDTMRVGKDNSSVLNAGEAALLNNLLQHRCAGFDFNRKKAAFITGSTGKAIVSKSDYFQNLVLPWIKKGDSVQIFMLVLTPKEKEEAGGYDVIVGSWVKVPITQKRRRWITNSLTK